MIWCWLFGHRGVSLKVHVSHWDIRRLVCSRCGKMLDEGVDICEAQEVL